MAELYHSDDIQEILCRAIARQAQTDELTERQMLEIADELGISHANLRLAEQEWFTKKGELQERQMYDSHQRREFKNHAVKYGIANGFLFAISTVTFLPISGALFVALLWGLGLSLHGWKIYHCESPTYEAAFQRWRRRRQITRSVNRVLNRWLGV